MTIQVSEVTTSAELQEFCRLPLRLHPSDLYVPVPEQCIRAWHAGHGHQRRYGPVHLYLARDRSGRPVGRICLHRNSALDAGVGRSVQLFGLTEFADLLPGGEDPAKELFDLAEQAGAVSGCDLLLGPVAGSPDESPGVLTGGFDRRGFSGGGWSPPYYAAAYERHGFTRRWPGRTWICEDLDDPGRLPPEKAFCFDDRRLADERLTVHQGRGRALRRVLPRLREILNASGQGLEQRTELSAEDFAALAREFGRDLDDRLLLWLARAGEPVAFVLAVPEAAPRGECGRGGPLGPFGPLGRLAGPRRGDGPGRGGGQAVLVAAATLPKWQRHGYLTLLARELYRNLSAAGYRVLRGPRVTEGDPGAEALYRGMGGRPLHSAALYQRPLH
jgi:GNAT superfamily N-acetyltransferase